MKILVTGASGFIASALIPALEADAHEVIPLHRPSPPAEDPSSYLSSPFPPPDAVIHLAGENIAQRWTPEAKARIRQSRVQGTTLLCQALARLPRPPQALLCASATGFYGNRGAELIDESSTAGTGFLADLARDWEAASTPAAAAGIRVVSLRFGVVMSPKGGALAKMLPAFRFGLGGKLGHGRQFWSWITLEDLVAAIRHILRTESLRGPVNLVSPQPVTNATFTQALARALHRPAFCRVPAFWLKFLFGEMAQDALLASCRVTPTRLRQTGFTFQWPTLEPALRHYFGG